MKRARDDDYLRRLLAQDRRRGTTLWAVFYPESPTLALTADPHGLIAELVYHFLASGRATSVLIGFYSVTFDAACPDAVLAAVATMSRDRFFSEEERRGFLDDVAVWSVLRHPHHVQFDLLPHREQARRPS